MSDIVLLDGARTADRLNQAVAAKLVPFPAPFRRTLTWDQGKEIARHQQLRHETGLDVYLCDPKSPWQRGSNENTNGLLRRFFPKGMKIAKIDESDIEDAAFLINIRPRKTLGYLSPYEYISNRRVSLVTGI